MKKSNKQCTLGFVTNQKHFSDGIKKLVEHCKKCVDKQGGYVEK
jgi:hypothetical protein